MTSNLASEDIAQHALELRRIAKDASEKKLTDNVTGNNNNWVVVYH